MSYQITAGGQIRRESDGAWIPENVGNADYQEYLIWASKNTPLPATSPELPVAIKRLLEYPSIHEQLEALYDARNGDPTKLADIDARIVAVKEKYPL